MVHKEKPVCLVTGGSGGIGQAIVRELAQKGWSVAINYHRSEQTAEDLMQQCLQAGVPARAVCADVSQPDAVEDMFMDIERNLGPVTHLVNNAGVDLRCLLTDTSEEDWDRIMNVNLKGPFLCCRRALPYMIHIRFGRIVNIASTWGITGASFESVYAASKGGLIALTKSLASELGPSGITVNAIAPGPIQTPMLDNELTVEEKNVLAADIPLGRLGYPQDVAALCSFLLSDQAGYINGQIIAVDGGWK